MQQNNLGPEGFSGHTAWQAMGVAIVFAWIYMATRTWAFSYDALTAVLTAERNGLFPFHPNHLFANGIGWCVFKCLGFMGTPVRAIFVFQTVNAGIAALAVGAFYFILAKRFSAMAGILGAAGLGLSYAFWSEAVDAGAYASTGLVAVILTGLIVQLSDDSSHTPPASTLTAGIILGAGILVHQMFLLTIPAFLILFLFNRAAFPTIKPVRSMALFLGGVALSGILPYVLVACFYYGYSFHQGLFWFFGPAGPRPNSGILNNSWWHWSVIQNVGPLWAGLTNSFMAQPPNGVEWFRSLGQGILAVGLVCLGVGTLWVSKHRPRTRPLLSALITWTITMNIFQFFWVPGTIRFRILFLPVFILWMCMVTHSASEILPNWIRKSAPIVLFLLIGIGLSNAVGTLYPAGQFKNNRNITRALWIQERMGSKDFFLFSGCGDSMMNVVPPYFAPNVSSRSLYGYFFAHPQGDFSEIGATIDQTLRNGGNVYIEEQLFNKDAWTDLAPNATVTAQILSTWFSRYGIASLLTGPSHYRVVQIRRKVPSDG